MERNQIFDNIASVGHTVAGLVTTLFEGKKSDLLGLSGVSVADGIFLSAVPEDGGKRDPILGVRLGPLSCQGTSTGATLYLLADANQVRSMLRSPLCCSLEALSFGLSKLGSLACTLGQEPTGPKISPSD